MCPTLYARSEHELKLTKVISPLTHRTTNGSEQWAIAQAAVRAFFLVPKGLTGPENGRILANAVRRMTRFATGNQPPFIAKVFRNSTVKMWERPRR
jgi:hypothetical protein